VASPQVEDGYTRIANELLEAIYSTGFNGTQFKILLCIIRYTYGFKRKSHDLSIGFISKATGVSRRYISAELSRLIDSKVITVLQEHTDTTSRVLALNKNYTQWNISRTNNQQVKNISTGELEQHTTDEELITTTDEELFTQERNNKENIKESSSSINNPPPLMNDENLKRISKAYKDNGFGILFPNAGQALLELADEYTIEWVELAMEKAGKMGKRNVAYVEGILKGWEREGQPSVEIGGQKEVSQPHYFKPSQYEFED
jgi:phage replication O-like protein O